MKRITNNHLIQKIEKIEKKIEELDISILKKDVNEIKKKCKIGLSL
tara:strand:+ start:252 stop:389 length:138 start_codon:yes stop_codon:yes gene_type:complete